MARHVSPNKKLSIPSFLKLLEECQNRERDGWKATLVRDCIHLRRNGSDTDFSPLTAVYWYLTKQEIHRGTFWCKEMIKEGLPWWDVLLITYASMALGLTYDRKLRESMLKICGLA